MGRTSTERLLKSQGLNRHRKLRRTRITICTYNARTLASEASVEDLMMQARKICTYNARTLASEASVEDLMMQSRKIKSVIGLTETRRQHPYTPPTTPEKNCSSEHVTAGE
ncbi:unnamed protein product [Heligmosomoides polygyrus]|uniref:Uncharacterized protein n=1 Tax=Heligmosomoides polygyrus TaxID=6339 RepID=A0A183F5G7_HELPZ|nr:unnamed protein product [Heligmosomoides polygyrus]